MTGDESAEQGAIKARLMIPAIQGTMQIPDLDRTAWWMGFLSVMTGLCYVEVGDPAHDIVRVIQVALQESSKPEGVVVQ